MNTRLLRAIAVGICLSVWASGCARTENDSAPGGITRAEFVKKADAICAETQEEFDGLFDTDYPTTPARLTAFFEKATPIFEQRVDSIRRLGTPKGDESKIRSLLAAGDRAVADFEASSKDTKKAQQILQEEGGENSQAFEKKARAYGLKKCSEDESEQGPEKLNPAGFSPGRRAFVEKGDAICRQAAKKGGAVEQEVLGEVGFPPPLEKWAEFLPRILEIDKSMVAQLRDLDPPSQDAGTIKEILDQRESLLGDAQETARLAADKDEEAFHKKLGKLFDAIEQSDHALVKYGFQVCGSDDDGEKDARE